jgi:hypothetical protein
VFGGAVRSWVKARLMRGDARLFDGCIVAMAVVCAKVADHKYAARE